MSATLAGVRPYVASAISTASIGTSVKTRTCTCSSALSALNSASVMRPAAMLVRRNGIAIPLPAAERLSRR